MLWVVAHCPMLRYHGPDTHVAAGRTYSYFSCAPSDA
jgi:hypothetical protein